MYKAWHRIVSDYICYKFLMSTKTCNVAPGMAFSNVLNILMSNIVSSCNLSVRKTRVYQICDLNYLYVLILACAILSVQAVFFQTYAHDSFLQFFS